MKIKRMKFDDLPFSLHDRRVVSIVCDGNDIRLNVSNGLAALDEERVEGYVLFENVDFEFCAAYLLSIDGREGVFRGRKYGLHEFIDDFMDKEFEIIDEVYAYNVTKLQGFLYSKGSCRECLLDIYHFGDMYYVI